MSDPLQVAEEPTDAFAPAEAEALASKNLMHLTPLQNYLGISTPDSKTSNQLEYIYGQVKGDKALNDGDILSAIREIKLQVGYPRLGETMIGRIYNYLRAQEQVKNAAKLRDAYLS